MSNVYFKKFNGKTTVDEVGKITQELLKKIIMEEKIKLEKEIPLKVHFGESGNVTFIKPENYDGIIDFLKSKKIKTSFIETSVLYGGQRYRRDLHLKTAKEHGFTRVPIIIADGECGENFHEVVINKSGLKKCMLGKEFLKYKQFYLERDILILNTNV